MTVELIQGDWPTAGVGWAEPARAAAYLREIDGRRRGGIERGAESSGP